MLHTEMANLKIIKRRIKVWQKDQQTDLMQEREQQRK